MRLPIREHVLKLLVTALPNVFQQQYLITLHKAILITMYYGLFRIREITQNEHVLKAKDVNIGMNKKKIMFILRSSKTHGKESKPQTIKINGIEFDHLGRCRMSKVDHYKNEAVENNLCPFTALGNYLNLCKKRKHDSEQFFVFSDRSLVTAACLHAVLKSLLIDVGLDHAYYSSHSIRAGCAIDLFDLGVDLGTIHKIGRWRSNTIYSCLKMLYCITMT